VQGLRCLSSGDWSEISRYVNCDIGRRILNNESVFIFQVSLLNKQHYCAYMRMNIYQSQLFVLISSLAACRIAASSYVYWTRWILMSAELARSLRARIRILRDCVTWGSAVNVETVINREIQILRFTAEITGDNAWSCLAAQWDRSSDPVGMDKSQYKVNYGRQPRLRWWAWMVRPSHLHRVRWYRADLQIPAGSMQPADWQLVSRIVYLHRRCGQECSLVRILTSSARMQRETRGVHRLGI